MMLIVACTALVLFPRAGLVVKWSAPRRTNIMLSDSAEKGDGREPMDVAALERDRLEMAADVPATAEQLAAHLPPWAADLMLDEDANTEYESTQARSRAAQIEQTRADERDPNEFERGGMAEFTPEELAEDYDVPIEMICAQLLAMGMPSDRLDVRAPVKRTCSRVLLEELLNFLGAADRIAMREELCDSTINELAEGVPFSAEQLLILCQKEELGSDVGLRALGIETRLRQADAAMLLDLIEREAAFLGLG